MRLRNIPLFAVLLAVSFLAFTGGASHADHGTTAVGIDVDPAGNTATSLGANDLCASVPVDATFQVDLWVHDAPGFFAWQATLNYDPAVLRVVAHDVDFLIFTDPGSSILDVSDNDLDQDGRYISAAADISAIGASGSGVLARMSLQAVGPGYSPLQLSGIILVDLLGEAIGDVTGDVIFDGPSSGGIVWVGGPCPGDADGDGVADGSDNCPETGNPDQADRDGDGVGDWCDDGDSDGNLDTVDNCPNTFEWGTSDTDGDGLGDACDPDIDNDGVPNGSDNAVYVANPDQADSDGDGTPDVLDVDADGDGIPDSGLVVSILANIGGDMEGETVRKTLNQYFVETYSDSDSDVDDVHAPVIAPTGSMHSADLDGDGELEVSIKDPGRAPGVTLAYDMRSADPDTDIDVVVLGGGDLGALVPAPVDLDGDGEMESLVWEPELMPGGQVNADLDSDGDTDVRWQNTQTAGVDNCPAMANAGQANNDMDAYGDDCDTDDDNDGYDDTAEATIGTGAFSRCGSGGWPSDFVSGGIPDSTNRVNVMDLTSFLAPVRHINTSPGDAAYSARWDLVPGAGVFTKVVNVSDLTALLSGSTGYPPMLGGARAFNGPPCP